MSKRIMISKHNSNNNILQKQMRTIQKQTDDSDASIESIPKNKNKYKTNLQQYSMIVNRKEDSDEDSDEELTPLHERLKWDNESDEEETTEQIERNRMSYNAKIKNDDGKKRYKKIIKITIRNKDYFQELPKSPNDHSLFKQ